MHIENIVKKLNLNDGCIEGAAVKIRKLSELQECFADETAYAAALAEGDKVVYSVSSIEPGDNGGDLHFGLGMIMPGRIGDEYYLTKGHFHEKREAAEIYIGLKGKGAMLLEDELSGDSRTVEIKENTVIYVPGNTAHRTYNTGSEPVMYLGIYPADAGHDYEAIKCKNFNCVVTATEAGPEMKKRSDYQK
ncbi:glucose-6-phosphate isomerase family protein [Lentisphaerota bacterium ZTH]|nr:cupin domain-containing protein [Lentisphaerota bacterium]WET05240.1 glucose-6-phosphate isomerase family protein [Lentisphaerota bacterium ZTH]